MQNCSGAESALAVQDAVHAPKNLSGTGHARPDRGTSRVVHRMPKRRGTLTLAGAISDKRQETVAHPDSGNAVTPGSRRRHRQGLAADAVPAIALEQGVWRALHAPVR